MEKCRSERYGPFHRNRRAPAFVEHLQRHRRLDVVMVREGDDGVLIQRFDLRFFEQPRIVRPHWRRPPAPRQIERRAMFSAVNTFAVPYRRRENRSARRGLVNEVQTLARVQRVTVQRHARAEPGGGRRIFPLQMNRRRHHALSSWKTDGMVGSVASSSASNVRRRNDRGRYSMRIGIPLSSPAA